MPIVWLEYRDNEQGFAIVTYETANRDGQPFEDLIRKRSYLAESSHSFLHHRSEDQGDSQVSSNGRVLNRGNAGGHDDRNPSG